MIKTKRELIDCIIQGEIETDNKYYRHAVSALLRLPEVIFI